MISSYPYTRALLMAAPPQSLNRSLARFMTTSPVPLASQPHPQFLPQTYQLYQSPILHQRALILDIVTPQPRLDLISQPLQLFDLRFEVIFQFIF